MRGHVRQRGNGWVYVIDLPRDDAGRRRQSWSKGYATRREAERALTAALRSLDTGTYAQISDQPFGDFLREWLDGRRAVLAPRSWNVYDSRMRTHIIPGLGGIPLSRLTGSRIAAYYTDRLRAGLAPRTVECHHRLIRRALADAVGWGLLQRNPTDGVRAPRTSRVDERHTVWSAEETGTFLRAAAADPLYPALRILAMTGMRLGEVLGLPWRDVDLERGAVTVAQQLSPLRGQLVLGPVKSAGARRIVALDAGTVAVLRAHRSAQVRPVDLGARSAALVTAYVDGSPVSASVMYHAFIRITVGAGLPRIRVHDLRHGWATLALAAGINVKIISERLGHASVAFTLQTYAHAMPGMQADAAERVAGLIDGVFADPFAARHESVATAGD